MAQTHWQTRLLSVANQEPMRALGLDRLVFLVFRYRREIKRFIKFAMVGTLGFMIDFSILNIMHKLAGWPLLAANSLSFTVAVISNFTWNRLWTFPESRSRRKRRQLPQFALVNIIGLAVNNFVLLNLTALFSHFLADPYHYNLAKALATIVVLFWNFGANRLWTYRGL